MARVPVIDPKTATGEAAELLNAVQAQLGITPNFIRVLANSPKALSGFLGLYGAAAGFAVDLQVEVGPDATLLKAIEAAGIAVPASCRAGTCGICATKVLEGRPDHRDSALTTEERTQAGLMCVYVSRALTPRLALDL